MIDPRTFIAEYIDPAISLWRDNPNSKHLAVHAITQLDVLAEIVLLWNAKGHKLPRNAATIFRDDLSAREPLLAIVRDAHDCHKHGTLNRLKRNERIEGTKTGDGNEGRHVRW
jgi:hypothetical protein